MGRMFPDVVHRIHCEAGSDFEEWSLELPDDWCDMFIYEIEPFELFGEVCIDLIIFIDTRTHIRSSQDQPPTRACRVLRALFDADAGFNASSGTVIYALKWASLTNEMKFSSRRDERTHFQDWHVKSSLKSAMCVTHIPVPVFML